MLIGFLGLAVGLRVVGHTNVLLNVQLSTHLLGELQGEPGVPVRNYLVGDSNVGEGVSFVLPG